MTRIIRPRRRFRRGSLGEGDGRGGGGAAIATGTSSVGSERGLVTLYRGVPYELPFGIDLYQKKYVSAVPVQALTLTERRRVLDHQLRSRKDAAALILRLEQGRAP